MPAFRKPISGVRPGRRFVSGTYPAYSNSGGSGQYPPLSMYANVYGPGIAVDSRGNLPVNASDVVIRFVASATSTITSVALLWRFGNSGYSAGTCGSYTIGIYADNGSGNPTGGALASVSYTPSAAEITLSGTSGDTRHHTHTFSSPPSVTQGSIYHVVVHNTDGTPASNNASINLVLRALGASYGGTSPLGTAQPAYSDMFATLYGGTFTLRNETPVVNITYANGTHDGSPYLIAGCGTGPQTFGGTTMVRQRFRPTGSAVNVTGIYVRPKKLTGAANLTVDLRTTGGSSIESISIPNASFASLATGCNDNGQQWVGAAFSQTRTLAVNTTYELRLSCTAGSTYRIESPLREEDAGGTGTSMLTAAHWTDRVANPEVSLDSGGTWGVIYSSFSNDMAFYFTKG